MKFFSYFFYSHHVPFLEIIGSLGGMMNVKWLKRNDKSDGISFEDILLQKTILLLNRLSQKLGEYVENVRENFGLVIFPVLIN